MDRFLPCSLVLLLLSACSSTGPNEGRKGSAVEVDALIQRGRTLLDEGKPAEAEQLFEEAADQDHGTIATRMWVLRSWMDQGRSNDTLDALDELAHAGQKGPEMDYLYGMAFARRAEGYLSQGVTDSSVEMNFIDATSLLKQAVEADGARYRDAYVPLARSAWFVQELETARWAADKSVETFPDDPEGWLARGRVAMAQFGEAQESKDERAEELWSTATESLTRAVELFGTPESPATAQRLAQAATELGHAWMWKGKAVQATDAYATAIAWGPDSFDYSQALQILRGAPADDSGEPSGFRPALEEGANRLRARGPLEPAAAALFWWLGWARFTDADWAASEEAFQEGLALAPDDLANSWFYVALARQYRKDHDGALQALRKGWDTDPAAIVSVASNAGGSLRAFEDLITWCALEEPARNLDGAFLSEILAEAFPDQPRHWNNVGLFLRDAGEELEIAAYKKKAPEPDPAVLSDLYGRSYHAYQRALELSPEDPQLINDNALMLHYHLSGDKAVVEGMYKKVIDLLEQRLAASDLPEDERTRFEQTKKDVGKNLHRLIDPKWKDPEEEAEEAKEAAKEAEAKKAAEAAPAAEKAPESSTTNPQ